MKNIRAYSFVLGNKKNQGKGQLQHGFNPVLFSKSVFWNPQSFALGQIRQAGKLHHRLWCFAFEKVCRICTKAYEIAGATGRMLRASGKHFS
ncbi:MAG: hypothetical protein KDC05_13725 [Bacteroidales bacterium]|nr:hypothetical protein [Bacteroidales bacterium]